VFVPSPFQPALETPTTLSLQAKTWAHDDRPEPLSQGADMREADTQRLTDGELYYIIQHGIRMTGMPAWGREGDEHDEDSWKLVYFIRHLSELTLRQVKDMKKLNPTTPGEMEEQRQDEEFLT
jgi:hypothetical protein